MTTASTLSAEAQAKPVSAPGESIALGKSLVITGTVTDISAGASQHEVTARFPNGLPVSSDASMESWMGYV